MKIYLFIFLLLNSFLVIAESRRPEETEKYQLYEYRYIEYLDDEKRAVVLAPDGWKYRVQVGNSLGKNYGLIKKIGPDMIELAEVVPHCEEVGGWSERINYLPFDDKKLPHEYAMKLETCDMWTDSKKDSSK